MRFIAEVSELRVKGRAGLLKETKMGKRRVATVTSKPTLSSTIPNGPVGQPMPRVEGPVKVTVSLSTRQMYIEQEFFGAKLFEVLCRTRAF
jgi:hypothetical protein